MVRAQPTVQINDRFNVLRSIAQKGGRDVSGWKIVVPRRYTGQWILHWTPPHFTNNAMVEAGLGTSAYSANRAIDGLIEQYKQQIKSERELNERRSRKRARSAFTVKDPSAPSYDLQLSFELARVVQRHGKWGVEQQGNKDMQWLAEQKAGVLNMTMRQYAATEMAAVFGRPPATEKEYKWMRSQLAAYHDLQVKAGFEKRN